MDNIVDPGFSDTGRAMLLVRSLAVLAAVMAVLGVIFLAILFFGMLKEACYPSFIRKRGLPDTAQVVRVRTHRGARSPYVQITYRAVPSDGVYDLEKEDWGQARMYRERIAGGLKAARSVPKGSVWKIRHLGTDAVRVERVE